jgi:hypothetical protein
MPNMMDNFPKLEGKISRKLRKILISSYFGKKICRKYGRIFLRKKW